MSDDGLEEFYQKAGSSTVPHYASGQLTKSVPEQEDCVEESSSNSFGTGGNDAVRRWAANDQMFWACSATYDGLPPGLYKPKHNNSIGYYLEKQIVDTDDLLTLPDTASEAVLNEINKFWTLKGEFHARGFIHKRGILMWGDPGSGKTATIQLMIKTIIEDGGIALFAGHPNVTTACLQMIRRIEPERKLIVIMEDFESMIREHGDSEYLAMLDGESQVGDVVFVATTNYPEKLDKRFIDRPSRFDTIKKIGMPTAEARRFYLTRKEPTLEGDELEKWVDLSEDMSIAHLKEMIISNRCYGIEIEKVVKRLNFMKKRKITSDNAFGNKGGFGFVDNDDDDDEVE